jgi:hypothetical protein
VFNGEIQQNLPFFPFLFIILLILLRAEMVNILFHAFIAALKLQQKNHQRSHKFLSRYD